MKEGSREFNRSPKDLKEEGFYKFGVDLSNTFIVIEEIGRLTENKFDAQARELKNLLDEYSKLSSKRK
ncbi:hypothetical protein A2356_00375 [Candidatus Nomurabacteria bacterium RIFOXYB1_FULL_39_16]|uniref:Uncharacterized protein n=2 Tax=Candidatus Nomuraibacteriota TaxID=1752729 RepID=A0A0G0TV06_9BACT|nr:MAG: hypothetical protein UT78_C0021G0003 [Candidatus Nomurabacteria bacterium GW2011_GWF2_40_12]OGJ09300.1 MAG: hypothetical protein A2356_00375 [Candidatus Nomurabacteria bacterium RIFOXYB1_FULL_39_16]OGJ14665.1 MAG: hypothetical protein A2585_01215 [Candidatus Nomurabacteria bacterium RIFOXYD1_FULL_39_12]